MEIQIVPNYVIKLNGSQLLEERDFLTKFVISLLNVGIGGFWGFRQQLNEVALNIGRLATSYAKE